MSELSEQDLKISSQMLELQKSLGHGQSVIGIDIGASSVNVAQCVIYQGKPTIIKVASEEIGLITDQERTDATVEALKRAIAHFDTRHADVVCAVSDQRIVVDYMSMPQMPDSELTDAIKIEVSSSEFFSIQDPVFDYQIVDRLVDKGVSKINVMVAAVPKSFIEKLLSYFKPMERDYLRDFKKLLSVSDFMGLNLIKVIPISIAFENILRKSKRKMEETLATLEIGSMGTELNIYTNGHLVFSRKINVTGLDFTRSLTSALFTNKGKTELTIQEAEWVKKEFGIPSPSEDFLIKDKITANQAIALLRPKLEQLIREIARSFDFYYDRNRDGKIDKLVLFGGGAMLKRLPEFLNSELGLPIGLGDSLNDLSLLYEGLLKDAEDAQRLNVAIGASLSDYGGMNLLPQRLRDSQKRFFQKVVLILVAGFFILASASFYVFMISDLNKIKQEELKLKNHNKSLLPQVAKMKSELLLQKIARERIDMGGLLKTLSYLPEKVYLTSIKLERGDLALSGFVTANIRESKKILKSVVGSGNIPLEDIRIASLKEGKGDQTTKFVIRAKAETDEESK